MAENRFNRRDFLKNSIIAPAGAAAGLCLEERILLAKKSNKTNIPEEKRGDLPMGRIGSYKISRMICGGNLISGFAHSRDLVYVSSLFKHYFTDEKIFETLRICEESGINTAILRLDDNVIRILKKYRKERGGKIQWIAQVKPKENKLTEDSMRAIDNGAIGAYVQGGVADKFYLNNRVDLIGKAVEFIKKNKVIAGVGAHLLGVVEASEKQGINPDFYMKTLHRSDYWSFTPERVRDNVWCVTPEKTIEFMKKVKKPWIAFKVMAAGAISPAVGFKYALKNGADFICAGMFDFQVRDDVKIVNGVFSRGIKRDRPWMG